MTAYLSPQQVTQLLHPIKPSRVLKLDGMSHLAAYDVRAHLNRVFGFGRWSADVLDVTPIYEQPTQTKGGKPAFAVAYRATVRLTVCAPDGSVLATYTECAAGDSTMPDFKRGDCHDMAIKTAESQALKRCATNLGDQFGLSLYANGSTAAVVGGTFVGLPPVAEASEKPASVDEAAPDVVPEQEHPDETPAPPAQTAIPASPARPLLDVLFERAEAGDSKDALNSVWADGKTAVEGQLINGAEWEQLKDLLRARFRDLEQEAAA